MIKSDKNNIKVFGERNSGTNYLIKLLEINFDVKLLNGTVPILVDRMSKKLNDIEYLKDLYFLITEGQNIGWKHRDVNLLTKEDRVQEKLKRKKIITITKNPYAWLLSMFNRPYHQMDKKKLTFEEFLVKRWEVVGRETCKNKFYRNPVEMWNKKNRGYLNLKKYCDVYNIKYEDLTINTENQLYKISEFLGLSFINHKPVNYTKPTKRKDKETQKDSDYYKNFHLNRLWIKDLSKDEINIINKFLDKDLAESFRYEVLDS